MMSKTAYILTFLLFTNLTYPSITDNIETIKTLQKYHLEAKDKIKSFPPLIDAIKKRIKELQSLLDKHNSILPDYNDFKNETHFSYYNNGITVYDTEKGQGIKIDDEKLYIEKNKIEYTHYEKKQYRKYKTLSGEIVEEVAIPQFVYWQKDKASGFKKISEEAKRLYRYSQNTENRTQKVILDDKIGYTFFEKENQTIIQLKNGHSIELTPYSHTYIFNPKFFYKILVDGNIILSRELKRKAFLVNDSKSQYYWNALLKDSQNTKYNSYFKMFCLNKKSTPEKLYLSLINSFRKEYALGEIRFSKTLNRLCKKHGDYLIKHQPDSNVHEEYRKRKGFTGETPFVRRKKAKYPYRVKEWISYGGDPIYNFIKLLDNPEWLYVLLHPHAVHMGFHRVYCYDGVKKNVIDVILLSYKNKDSKVFPLILYPKSLISMHKVKRKITEKKGFCAAGEIDYKIEKRKDKYLFQYHKAVTIPENINKLFKPLAKNRNIYKAPINFNVNFSYTVNKKENTIKTKESQLIDYQFESYF